MKATYSRAAVQANAAALFFAERGHHVTTAFGGNCGNIEVSVFFYNCDDRNLIESFMTLYEDDNDTIEFHKFEHNGKRPFYTLTLKKYLS